MHISTRTKYSNKRFTTPSFKCHMQFIAGCKWTSLLTAAELHWHWSGKELVWKHKNVSLFFCFFLNRVFLLMKSTYSKITTIYFALNGLAQSQHFGSTFQPLLRRDSLMLGVSGLCKCSGGIFCNPSNSAGASPGSYLLNMTEYRSVKSAC